MEIKFLIVWIFCISILGSYAAMAISICTIALDRGAKNRDLLSRIQELVNTLQFKFPHLCGRPIVELDDYEEFAVNGSEDVYIPT